MKTDYHSMQRDLVKREINAMIRGVNSDHNDGDHSSMGRHVIRCIRGTQVHVAHHLCSESPKIVSPEDYPMSTSAGVCKFIVTTQIR